MRSEPKTTIHSPATALRPLDVGLRRLRSGIAVLVVSSLSLVLAPAPSSAAAVQAGDCAATLTCTAEQINTMSMPARLSFLRAISPSAAPGFAPRWGNVEGVLEFFTDRGLGSPGSWVSYVDAGDLEAIERGIAIATGRGTDTFGNPGSALWASYLYRLRAGDLSDRSEHDKAWSEAEQASIDDGVALADQTHHLTPTPVESRFFQFTQFYRWVLRNRPFLLDLGQPQVGPGQPPKQKTFLDWFTDVTNDVPARKGAALSYDVALFNLPAGVFDFIQIYIMYEIYLFQG